MPAYENFTNTVKDMIGKDPDTLKMILAAGGASALAGGYLSSKIKKKGRGLNGETPGERRKRIILNAILTGTAGAGAAGLLSAGGKKIVNAIPKDEKADAWEGLLANNQGALGTAALGGGAYAGARLTGPDAKSVQNAEKLFLDFARNHTVITGPKSPKTNTFTNVQALNPAHDMDTLNAFMRENPSIKERLMKDFVSQTQNGYGKDILRTAGLRSPASDAGAWLKNKFSKGTGVTVPAKANFGTRLAHDSGRVINKAMASNPRIAAMLAAPAAALLAQKTFLNPDTNS